MTKSMKAALLSGLVFPGLGQIYLKRYRRGVAIMLSMLALLGLLIGMVVMTILRNINGLQGKPDMGDASRLVASLSDGHLPLYNLCFFLVVCCWLISIIDAYRIGKS